MAKNIVLGIIAHVDSGKTTLSEQMLYQCGVLKEPGRVDHKNTYFDYLPMERQRKITIFSKQARIEYHNTRITLLDTPGHADFSAELERSFLALDYAVLVMSAMDGVRAHTKMLWKLLARYCIPTFVFINKMDASERTSEEWMCLLKEELSEQVVYLPETSSEEMALFSETLLEEYMQQQEIATKSVQQEIARRNMFPVVFGAALKGEGVTELLDTLDRYTIQPEEKNEFAARVFKIERDSSGKRLTYIKVLGGILRPKDTLCSMEEKIHEIRLYSGEKYQLIDEAHPGEVVALTGPKKTYVGEGLGVATDQNTWNMVSSMRYQLIVPQGQDTYQLWQKLQILAEEDPDLMLAFEEDSQNIYASFMGQVQIEVLQELIYERFSIQVSFDEGDVIYQETIAKSVTGEAVFDVIRHFAQVKLLIEPSERGSGIVVTSQCSAQELALNYQHQIMNILSQLKHMGPLSRGRLTDVNIILLSGKAHQKHTQGGDFAEATAAAMENALKQAKGILLEPYMSYILTLPVANMGRAMTDLNQQNAVASIPEMTADGRGILRGRIPASMIRHYATEVAGYTKGQGELQLEFAGYDICQSKDISDSPEQNLQTKTDACVKNKGMDAKKKEKEYNSSGILDKELEEIFVREFGEIKRPPVGKQVIVGAAENRNVPQDWTLHRHIYIIDGYNVIFALEELKNLAAIDLHAARGRLLELVSNFQGHTGYDVRIVFDAYQRPMQIEQQEKYLNVMIIYTKENQTADAYIEKLTGSLQGDEVVTVVTSDAAVQQIILGHGALRMSSKEFEKEMQRININGLERYQNENYSLRRSSSRFQDGEQSR